jgi:prevent-host-death family protein
MVKAKGVRKARIELQAEEARRSFSDCLERVAYQDERVVVSRFGKPIAALVSIADLEKIEGAA